jgi:sugar phosphate isomerase/epimerase
MVRTAIQLYTLRELEEPVWDVVSRVGSTTFDGVEFYDAHFDAFKNESALKRTRTALETADLSVAGAHLSVDRIESSFEEVIEICSMLDISTLVVPSYDREAFASVTALEAAVERLADLAAALASHDVELLYHNHSFEFADLKVKGESRTAFEVFVDRTNGRFGFEPDLGLATRAGCDPLELLSLVSNQTPVAHITDTVPDDPDRLHADVGAGVVNWRECTEAAREHGAEWIICENGVTADGLASLEHGSEAFAGFRSEPE